MSNIQRLREAYARYSGGDFAFADSAFASDIDWEIVGSPAGRLHGREAVKGFFAGLAGEFAGHAIELRDAVESGDRLVAFVEHRFTRQDGSEQQVAAVHDWTWRDGRAVRLYELPDTLAVAVAFGTMPAEALAGRA